MPISLFKKVTVHIDTTKYSRDEKKTADKNPKALQASIKAQVAREKSKSQKYSRSSNNRRRNG